MKKEIIRKSILVTTVIISISFSSCLKVVKNYIIRYLDKDGNEIRKEEIKSDNDTLAYLEAYKKFCVTKKVEADVAKKMGGDIETRKFALYNASGEEITDISFNTKENEEKEIEKNYLGEAKEFIEEKEEKDSAKIKELSNYFNIETDEFDVNKRKWYKAKGCPKFVNVNAIYFYFEENNGKANNLRLKIQYSANDWLFIEKYIFNIDGFPIEYVPEEVKRDNNNKIWEWSDQQMTAFEASLINTIRYCKNIKVKFVGTDYSDVRTLSQKEINDMKKTIELYEAMGGELD